MDESATNELEKYLKRLKKDTLKEIKKYTYECYARRRYSKVVDDVAELCKKGADLTHLERERRFALIPCVYWSKKLIRFFVDRGADVNSRDEKGDTALHLAIRHAKYDDHDYEEHELFKYLLNDLKADPNVTNLREETAFFTLFKCIGQETTLSERTLSMRSSLSAMVNLVKMGEIGKLANLLVERGADVTTRNCDGENVLHIALFNGCLNDGFIREFKEDVKTSSWLYSKTVLMIEAIDKCKRDFDSRKCRLLLESGANVNSTDLQGYTALHHAVLRGVHVECAQYLVEKGADPSLKSSSGRDAFDLNVRNVSSFDKVVFIEGATPSKQVEILQIVGAMKIIVSNKRDDAIKLWDQAMDVCKEFDLQPSPEFVEIFEFIRDINPEEPVDEEIRRRAMNVVARLSHGTSKFWNFFSLNIDSSSMIFFDILNFLSEDLKRVEDFASLEEIDFYSLLQVVKSFADWLNKLVKSGSKNEAEQRISHVHSIARLSIACFNKLTHETNSYKVSDTCMELYVTLCHVLTSLHSRFADIIPESEFNENKILLKNLMKLDLRDRDLNTLMHIVLRNEKYEEFEPHHLGVLLDNNFESVINVKAKNREGFQPVLWMKRRLPLNVLDKLADRGAHVDARIEAYARRASLDGTIRDTFLEQRRPDLAFKYDSLQCACARVLARSLVPYVNRVPEKIADFINMH